MLDNDVALVIDDSATVRRIIATLLRDYLGCRNIIEADNGSGALRVLHSRRDEITWIFCDWEMPGLNGHQFLMEVRSRPETAQTPFIMVTTRADRDSLVKAVEAGVDAYVVKPFTATTLVDKVRTIVHRSERRKAERVKVDQDHRVVVLVEIKGHSGCGSGTLIDISLNGALLRLPNSFGRNLWVYDPATLRIVLPGGDGKEGGEADPPIVIPTEVVRVEADNKSGSRSAVCLAFRFLELERGALQRLTSFQNALREQSTVPRL